MYRSSPQLSPHWVCGLSVTNSTRQQYIRGVLLIVQQICFLLCTPSMQLNQTNMPQLLSTRCSIMRNIAHFRSVNLLSQGSKITSAKSGLHLCVVSRTSFGTLLEIHSHHSWVSRTACSQSLAQLLAVAVQQSGTALMELLFRSCSWGPIGSWHHVHLGACCPHHSQVHIVPGIACKAPEVPH